MLFAKVIELKQEASSTSSEPLCKIRLGYQTPRGIIDVYLYMLSKYDRKRYELIKFLTPSSPVKTTLERAIPVLVGGPQTANASPVRNNQSGGGNPVTPSQSSSTTNNSSSSSESSESTSRRTRTTTRTTSEEIGGNAPDVDEAAGGVITEATYSLPSPPHSYPSSLGHESMSESGGGGGPPHAHDEAGSFDGDLEDDQDQNGSMNGERRFINEDDEEEYDGDMLFSDLAGYFVRMKQAAHGINLKKNLKS